MLDLTKFCRPPPAGFLRPVCFSGLSFFAKGSPDAATVRGAFAETTSPPRPEGSSGDQKGVRRGSVVEESVSQSVSQSVVDEVTKAPHLGQPQGPHRPAPGARVPARVRREPPSDFNDGKKSSPPSGLRFLYCVSDRQSHGSPAVFPADSALKGDHHWRVCRYAVMLGWGEEYSADTPPRL
eukprot:453526-Prorocentrum_minimum.AAC.1